MEVTHLLKHEHRVIEQALRGLDGLCLRLEHGEAIPLEALMAVSDFFSTYAESFHRGKEERILIPTLEKLGILQDAEALRWAVHEHGIELEVVQNLKIAIDLYSRGDLSSAPKLVECARKYSDMLVAHFEREDSILFPLVEEFLEDSAKSEMAVSMRGAEIQLGANGVKKYEGIAESLDETWTV